MISELSGSKAAAGGPVVVVEDDAKILNLLRAYLVRAGFEVLTAEDGRTALKLIRERRPQLVLLDLMLPEVDGMTVVRLVRQDSDVPIIILSAKSQVPDRVSGLRYGADDYITKPFAPSEVMARIEAVLRRARTGGEESEAAEPPQEEDRPVRFADLVIDPARFQVRRERQVIPLSVGEFRLLLALVRAGGRVLSRDRLLDLLSSDSDEPIMERSVDVYIGRVRAKLGDDPERPRYIVTVRGVGYRAAPES